MPKNKKKHTREWRWDDDDRKYTKYKTAKKTARNSALKCSNNKHIYAKERRRRLNDRRKDSRGLYVKLNSLCIHRRPGLSLVWKTTSFIHNLIQHIKLPKKYQRFNRLCAKKVVSFHRRRAHYELFGGRIYIFRSTKIYQVETRNSFALVSTSNCSPMCAEITEK